MFLVIGGGSNAIMPEKDLASQPVHKQKSTDVERKQYFLRDRWVKHSEGGESDKNEMLPYPVKYEILSVCSAADQPFVMR